MSLMSKKMNAFMAVAQTGSLSKAPEALALTTSSVSRMIGEFESFFNMKLFERTNKGFELNDAGVRLYQQLRYAYTELKAIEDDIRQRGDRNKPGISVCYDWDKEPVVFRLQEILLKSNELSYFTFHQTDPQRMYRDEGIKENGIYITSSPIASTGHSLFIHDRNEYLCHVSGRSHGDVGGALIITECQSRDAVFHKHVMALQWSGKVERVIRVSSGELMREMILNHHGTGLIPLWFSRMKLWQGVTFTRADVGGALDTYVCLPDTVKAMNKLKRVIAGFFEIEENRGHQQKVGDVSYPA